MAATEPSQPHWLQLRWPPALARHSGIKPLYLLLAPAETGIHRSSGVRPVSICSRCNISAISHNYSL